MKKISIAALFLLISSIAFSANLTNQDIQSHISVENTLNSMCRGGRGDDPDTGRACDARNKTLKVINRLGWCYGKKNQAAYQMKWHPCTVNSSYAR